MNYKIGVFVDEYLTLLEFQEKAEDVLAGNDISIFTMGKLAEYLADDIIGYHAPDNIKAKACDILIILSAVDDEFLKGFDGTIIDITGRTFKKGFEVIKISEPILKVVENLNISIDKLDINLQLPAIIYGKDGVEDLMRQSRDIFTFADNENLILKERLAFNIHVSPDVHEASYVSNTIGVLREAGADLNISLIPLSTVFRLDIYSDTEFDLVDDDGFVTNGGFFMASDVADTDKIFVIKHRYGYTFLADYNKVMIATVIEKLHEVTK